MDAEYRAADVFVARTRINIEQALPHRDDQQNDGKQQAEPGVLIREPAPEIQHDAEAHAQHGHALQQAERARQLAFHILQRHCRCQNPGDHEHHDQQVDVVQEREHSLRCHPALLCRRP